MAQLRITSMGKEITGRVSPEDEILVRDFKPAFDFKKQAIAASINYWLATKKVLIGEYAHHLYDFLVANQLIAVTREQILDSFAIEKQAALDNWLAHRDTMSEEAYNYNVDLINTDKMESVKQKAKVRILRDIMRTNPIDLEKVKDML